MRMSDVFILSLMIGFIFVLLIVLYMVKTIDVNDDDDFIMW